MEIKCWSLLNRFYWQNNFNEITANNGNPLSFGPFGLQTKGASSSFIRLFWPDNRSINRILRVTKENQPFLFAISIYIYHTYI